MTNDLESSSGVSHKIFPEKLLMNHDESEWAIWNGWIALFIRSMWSIGFSFSRNFSSRHVLIEVQKREKRNFRFTGENNETQIQEIQRKWHQVSLYIKLLCSVVVVLGKVHWLYNLCMMNLLKIMNRQRNRFQYLTFMVHIIWSISYGPYLMDHMYGIIWLLSWDSYDISWFGSILKSFKIGRL